MTNITILLLLFGVVTSALIAVWLLLAYRNNKQPLVKYFAAFFVFKVPALLGVMLGTIYIESSLVLGGTFYNIGSLFFHLSLVPLGLVVVTIWLPRFRNLILATTVLGAILAGGYSFVQPITMPTIPITSMLSGVVIGGWYTVISHHIFMTLPGFLFVYRGFRTLDQRLRMRSLMLGSGMAIASITGTLIVQVPEQTTLWLSLNPIGHFLMLAGVVYRIKK